MVRIEDILKFLHSEGIDCDFQGDKEQRIIGFSSLSHYKPNTMTWIKTKGNIPPTLKLDSIALIIVQKDIDVDAPNIITTSQSKRAFFSCIDHFFGEDDSEYYKTNVGMGTYISPNVKMGKNVKIGHNCTLEGNITIGDNTVIYHNVTIVNRVVIGANCIIQSGNRIGHDGFAYTEDNNHIKTMVKHYGGVHIGNNVYMGMNNCIARSVIDDTIIGDGVKIADFTHIGHNVEVGDNSTLILCSLYGSVKVGPNAYIVASTVRNQISIGEGSMVGMGSIVTKDVPAGVTVIGSPAKPHLKSSK